MKRRSWVSTMLVLALLLALLLTSAAANGVTIGNPVVPEKLLVKPMGLTLPDMAKSYASSTDPKAMLWISDEAVLRPEGQASIRAEWNRGRAVLLTSTGTDPLDYEKAAQALRLPAPEADRNASDLRAVLITPNGKTHSWYVASLVNSKTGKTEVTGNVDFLVIADAVARNILESGEAMLPPTAAPSNMNLQDTGDSWTSSFGFSDTKTDSLIVPDPMDGTHSIVVGQTQWQPYLWTQTNPPNGWTNVLLHDKYLTKITESGWSLKATKIKDSLPSNYKQWDAQPSHNESGCSGSISISFGGAASWPFSCPSSNGDLTIDGSYGYGGWWQWVVQPSTYSWSTTLPSPYVMEPGMKFGINVAKQWRMYWTGHVGAAVQRNWWDSIQVYTRDWDGYVYP